MRTALELLSEVQIPVPCPVLWEDMVGDERVRHCAQCNQDVYDLSALPADEAVALLQAWPGPVCVQLYRRPDGTVLTADCAAERQTQARRWWAFLGTIAAVLAALLVGAGLGSRGTGLGKNEPEPAKAPAAPAVAGPNRLPEEDPNAPPIRLGGRVGDCWRAQRDPDPNAGR